MSFEDNSSGFTMQEVRDPEWWQSFKFHMSPSWNIPMSTTADEKKLKENIEIRLQQKFAPNFMPIESLLFRAWLDVPLVSFQNSRKSLAKALEYVEEAEKHLLTKEDKFAHVGYGTVVYAFLIWIHEKGRDEEECTTAKRKLLDLLKPVGTGSIGELHPKARAYVHATHAFALSRLGEEHARHSVNLLKIALRRHPGNKDWQFLQVKILFRILNMQKLATFGYSNNPMSPSLKRKFLILKDTLEKMNVLYPNFHWANAYLGFVLSFLDGGNSPRGESIINEALDQERMNVDIVLLAVRLYKQMRLFERCFDLLHGIPEHLRTNEFYFQLGILYYEQFRDSDDNSPSRASLLYKSLENIEKALEKDSCKFPALLKRAEMYAKYQQLDDSFPKKANDFYRDVMDKCNEKANKANAFHATRSMTYMEVSKIFRPINRVNNCFRHFEAIVRADQFAYRDDKGRLIFSLEYKNSARRVTGTLFKIFKGMGQSEDEQNASVRERASLCLAMCNQIQGETEKAIRAYKTLVHIGKLEILDKDDVNYRLAQCYFSLGKHIAAKRYLYQSNVTDAKKVILLTDIYTSEAKQLQKQIKDKLAKAINMKNLESCLEMLLAQGDFCQDFFSVRGRVAQILANINMCMKEEHIQNAVNVDGVKTVQKVLKHKLDKVLQQPTAAHPLKLPIFKDTFKGLSNLRSALMEFECSLLGSEATSVCSTEEGSVRCIEGNCDRQMGGSTSWQTDCQSNAKEVLKRALSSFHQSISCLQATLLSSEIQHNVVENSARFPIISWRNEDEADEFLASDDLQNLLVDLFPDDFDAYIPQDVFDYLLQIQPRVDKRNVWLEVLSKCVEDLKNDTLPQDTYKYTLGSESNRQNFCTVHIARKSCEEAEKMVLTVLKRCQELLDQSNEKVGQLRNYEE